MQLRQPARACRGRVPGVQPEHVEALPARLPNDLELPDLHRGRLVTAPELDLAAVKARIAGATEGPWAADVHSDGRAWIDMPSVDGHAFGMHGFGPDAEFIAHARTDMPALVDRLEQAEAEVERLRGVVAGVEALGRNWLRLSGTAMTNEVREWTAAAGRSVLHRLKDPS